MARLETLVVGGGIGGLTTALALSLSKRRVHVVEKAPEFGEIGAGLQLAPNAMHVLDRIGVLPEIGKHAVYPSRLVWMDALSGTRITAVDLGEAFQKRYGHPYIVMHRSDLLTVLLEACKANKLITLEASRTLTSVEDLGDAARARFSDGTAYEAELLIGADGLWSTVRGAIVKDEPVCMGYVAYRGTLPIEQMSRHAGLDNVVMWIGPDMHFVQYPIRRGELYNQVAVFRSKRYVPGSDQWGLVEELDAHYAQTCEYVQGCIKVMWRDKRWPMHDRLPVLTWTRNRIGLLGDAAHPMFQYIAQGACQAIEDGLCLARHVRGGTDPAKALVAYEAERRLRTARVQLTARAMGAFFHLEGIPALVRNDMMLRRAHDDYSMLDWLYGHKV
ncbi:MAG TPA: FAD-dependent monooxygenase [Alphaproteobacteria bacterium]|nr:FAD-dependent monooxygenase [Alphaproteobacteria bacterium]